MWNPPGFHTSLGRVKPCTLELRKMRDFVPVRRLKGRGVDVQRIGGGIGLRVFVSS
jgi:hypothetical protein